MHSESPNPTRPRDVWKDYIEPALRKFLAGCGLQESDRQDILQRISLEALRYETIFNSIDHAIGHFIIVAKSRIKDHRRSENSYQSMLQRACTRPTRQSEEPGLELERREQNQKHSRFFEWAFGEMPKQEAAAMRLLLLGYSHQRAADALGIEIGSFYNLVSQARATFRELRPKAPPGLVD